jgi:hypothetical protein
MCRTFKEKTFVQKTFSKKILIKLTDDEASLLIAAHQADSTTARMSATAFATMCLVAQLNTLRLGAHSEQIEKNLKATKKSK